MFRKKTKKGFTIVELVIVIAVIAILSAVLIPTFAGLIKKANISADQTLVRNLNTSLAISSEGGGTKNSTMYQTLEAMKEQGYVVDKLTPTHSKNNIVWDSENNQFVLVYENGETFTGTTVDPTVDKSKMWKVYTEIPTESEYSVYLAGTNVTGNVEVKGVGFDAGENVGISTVTYKNETNVAKDVVIRTNSAKTNLTIDAPSDTIYHYNTVGAVNVIRTANGSYHEVGIAAFIQVASGRFVAEAGSKVEAVVLTEKGENATLDAIIENNGGTIVATYATSAAVIEANNADAKSEKITVAENIIEVTAIEEIKNEVVSVAVKEEEKENNPTTVSYGCSTDKNTNIPASAKLITTQAELITASESYVSGTTLYLGEGEFSVQDTNFDGKDVIIQGSGFDKTIIKYGKTGQSGEYSGCYSFEGSNVTFRDVTLSDYNGTKNYTGFIRVGNLNFDNCYLNSMMTYAGGSYSDYRGNTTFNNCTYENDSDYLMWLYGVDGTYNFNNCLFKSATGKFFNAYHEATSENKININFTSCQFLYTGESNDMKIYGYALLKNNQVYVLTITDCVDNFADFNLLTSKVTEYSAEYSYSSQYVVAQTAHCGTKVVIDGKTVYEKK